MGKIIVKIEITGIEGWATNWSNESDVKEELAKLNYDVKRSIVDGCGLNHIHTTVESELITKVTND